MAAVAAGMAFPGPLAAQTAPAAGIEQIVVTARKRVENPADVPLAVTALSGAELGARGVATSPELAFTTPNLLWHSILGFSSPQISLRGISNTTFNANQANPVAVHTDGVYQGASVVYGFGLFDLERVEILKGPQGTLFGRNTTGGVINFISRKPDAREGTNGFVKGTYGRFDEVNLEAAAGAALSERAAVRVAGVTLNRKGYVENNNPAAPFGRAGKLDLWSARGQARWQDDRVDALFEVHGGENRSDVVPGKQVGVLCPPGVAVPRIGACSDFLGFTDSTNLRETFENMPSSDVVKTWGASGTLRWQGAEIAVVSQTAVDANDRRFHNDSDSGPAAAVITSVASDFEQFSQELRLESAAGAALPWIAGASYYRDKLDAFQAFSFNALGPGVLSGAFPFEEAIASGLVQKTESYAVFGESSIPLGDRLTVTAGLRWTHDERRADTRAFLMNADGLDTTFITEEIADSRLAFPTIPAMQVEKSWGKWSGRAILSYELSDGVLAFGGVSRGFKGGDFNGGALFTPLQAVIANPEFVTSYEAGVKGADPSGRFTYTVSAFFNDFTDQQIGVVLPGSATSQQTLANAAKTRVKGLEADVSFLPLETWLVSLKAGVLDAEFKEFQLDPSDPATDYAGNRTTSAPKFSFTGLTRYTIPLGANALSLQAEAVHKSAHYFSVDNDPTLHEDGYWIANGRVAYEIDGGRYSVALWVKNATGAKYFLSGLGNTGLGFLELIPGMPRTYGVTVAAAF